MDPIKVERISNLAKEKAELESLISWHENKHFVFADLTINQSSPMHSQLLAVFHNRLKYIKSELEAE